MTGPHCGSHGEPSTLDLWGRSLNFRVLRVLCVCQEALAPVLNVSPGVPSHKAFTGVLTDCNKPVGLLFATPLERQLR